MPQLKINRIHLRNWTTVQNQVVELPDYGLIHVSGDVGAGKTALGEALSRTTVGISGRYTHLGHYSRMDKGNTLIRVEGTFGPDPCWIMAGYKCKELSTTGEGLTFNFKDGSTARPHVNQTREELGKILGVQPILAEWTVFINGDQLDWGDSSLSHQEKVSLLMMALNQPSWESHHETAKQTRNVVRMELSTKEGQLSATVQTHARAVKLVEEAEAAFSFEQDKFDEARRLSKIKVQTAENELHELEGSLASAEKSQNETRKAIKLIEDTLANEIHAIEVEELSLSDTKAAITSSDLQPFEIKKASIESQISELRDKLLGLQAKKQRPKACSLCGRPFASDADEEKHREEEAKQITEKIQRSKADLSTIETSMEPIRMRLAKVTADIGRVLQRKKSIRGHHSTEELSSKLDALDSTMLRLNRSINEKKLEIAKLKNGPSSDAIVKAKSVLDDRRKQLSVLKEQLPKLEEDVKNDKLTVSVLDYWVSAFSPAGIPNLVLQQSIEPLNQISQVLSHRITSNKLSIAFSTTKTTATNEQRNGLTIQVKNTHGATRVGGGSKGESGLTNFIIAETLSTVGRISHRVGFRWYDEVLNTQDSLTRQRILVYLREKAHELKIPIFFVSHHSDVSGLADRILFAEKTQDGGTTYHWRG